MKTVARTVATFSAVLFLTLISLSCLAYPEMIRHGYTNCLACHTSVNGGGEVLTDYGHNLSGELMSTWGSEKEARPTWGLLNTELPNKEIDQWLGLGGNYRSVQTFNENQYQKSGMFIWMQASLAAAYRLAAWTGAMSIGELQDNGSIRPVATSYWLQNQISEFQYLKAGVFVPAFGINTPDHKALNKAPLGFGIDSNRTTLEYDYIGDRWNVALDLSQAPQESANPKEKAASVQVQKTVLENSKLGASFWHGESDSFKRDVVAIHGIFGFTPKFYALSELDQQLVNNLSSGITRGYFGAHKIGYEWFKGFHTFFLIDHSQADSQDSNTLVERWGPGVQFFPRPHFELSGTFTKRLKKSISNEQEDYAWILFHFYL